MSKHDGHPKSLQVINLFAGPGAGKSTTAASLFSMMKSKGYKVELVTEVAKDFTYMHYKKGLRNQLLVLGLQDDRLRRLVGEVDVVITDSPLALGLAYLHKEYSRAPVEEAIWWAFERYSNFNFFIHRVKAYQKYGRSQTEQEAAALDEAIYDIFLQAADGEFPGTVHHNEVEGAADAAVNILSVYEAIMHPNMNR